MRRTVIRRVLDGGDGVMRGGKSERSSFMGDCGLATLFEQRLLDKLDAGGVVVLSDDSAGGDDMMAAVIEQWCETKTRGFGE